MSERMIIDALPVRNNILLGIMEIKTGNVVVDAMIQSAFRVCIEELDGTQHDAHYEIHDGNGQWFVEGKDDKFSEHGNVTHWMYYPAAPKD